MIQNCEKNFMYFDRKDLSQQFDIKSLSNKTMHVQSELKF